MSGVRLQNISKFYGQQQVLHEISMQVHDGEFMVFVGPSGCGKSTLLRMIAGLEEISGGDLWIDDKLANAVPPAKRGLAMVFQSYALYPHMSVYDNMAFSLSLTGMPRAAIDDAVQKAAAILQITPLLQRKPRDLSGGQRQRVAIGRAIVRQPGLFLFDEPLSNLDAGLRVQMRMELSKLHRELGATMIYVTHDQVEAMTLGQRIAVFNGGRIEQLGTPLDLYEHPANLFVAGFLGTSKMNFLRGKVVDIAALQLQIGLDDGGHLHLPAPVAGIAVGDVVTVGIRAEHIVSAIPMSDVESGGTGASDNNMLALQLRFIEHLGDAAIVYAGFAACETLLAARLSADHAHRLASASGDGVSGRPRDCVLRMHLPPERCHLFDVDGNALTARVQARIPISAIDEATTVF